jgi:hypothetical protein
VDDNLVPFFRSSNFQKLATNAINSVEYHFAGQFNTALSPVNAQLRGPAQYVRVGLWARATRITIAFAPPELTPPVNGSMTGLVRWNPERTLSITQDAPLKCAAIRLVSLVQTGPAPLLDPDDYSNVGVAPTRQIGSFGASSAGDACNYTLSGIAATWPNRVNATMTGGNNGSMVTTSFVITPDGWNGVVVPAPGAPGHNYLVAEKISGVASKVDIGKRLRNPADPVINPAGNTTVNPAEIRTQPAAVAVTPAVNPVNPAAQAPVAPSPLVRGTTRASSPAVKVPTTAPQSTLGR